MIRIDNVSYSYFETTDVPMRYALRDIALHIQEGEYIGFIGHNGSGKSTLARMLNGLLLPTVGSVTVDGLSTADSSAIQELRRTIQLVFQNPENQIVGVNPEEDVAFGLSNIGYPQRDMAERINWALQQVELSGDARKPIFELSGGQKQKLALASVLALSPRYVILDEATSMLDPAARDHFLHTLHRLRETGRFGLIHITHHLEEVRHADRLVLMRDGAVEAIGSPESLLLDKERLESCGLEMPYLAEISAHLRKYGVEVPVWPTEEELVRTLCKSN